MSGLKNNSFGHNRLKRKTSAKKKVASILKRLFEIRLYFSLFVHTRITIINVKFCTFIFWL